MRISDWSSDVCSSDLVELHFEPEAPVGQRRAEGIVGQQSEQEAQVQRDVGEAAVEIAFGRLKRLAEEAVDHDRSEEHTSELQSLMRISYAVFCLKKKKRLTRTKNYTL